MRLDLRKILALLVALTILLPFTVTASSTQGSSVSKDVEQAIALGLVPSDLQNNYNSGISRKDFCRLIITFASLKGAETVKTARSGSNPFTDTSSGDVTAAYNLGITSGTSAKTFSPERLITGQEAAAMIYRTAEAFGLNVSSSAAFAGDAAVWATAGLNYVSASKILPDVVKNPKGTIIRQDAFAAVLRLHNMIKETNKLTLPMKVTSKGIVEGKIDLSYGMFGEQYDEYYIPTKSLPLEIKNAPAETKSFAIIMLDPDSVPICGYKWLHWTAANIVSSNIPENASVSQGVKMVQGTNDFGTIGYGGPTPPNTTHNYVITVYALDSMLDLKEGFSQDELMAAMEGHVLKTSAVNGSYISFDTIPMELSSESIINGKLGEDYGMFTLKYYNEDWIPTRSPQLTVDYSKDGTESFAIIMRDLDSVPVCGYEWIHWLAADIEISEIPENASIDLAKTIVQGKNDFGAIGYGGPTPPDKTHNYAITVYALDTKLNLKEGFSQDELLNAMKGHIIEEATIKASYRSFEAVSMAVTSSSIVKGVLQDKFGKFGTQLDKDGIPTLSPMINVTGAPLETECLAIVMLDPDSVPVCGYEWIHWTAANILSYRIPENASIDLKKSMIQGETDFGTIGYGGPMPPDKPHNYKIIVYALDTLLDLKEGYTYDELMNAMKGHILAQCEVKGIYRNK